MKLEHERFNLCSKNITKAAVQRAEAGILIRRLLQKDKELDNGDFVKEEVIEMKKLLNYKGPRIHLSSNSNVHINHSII